MSKSNRRPSPRVTPRNVAEYLLDLEARAVPGEGDFEVPASDWLKLQELAGEAIPFLNVVGAAPLSAHERELGQLVDERTAQRDGWASKALAAAEEARQAKALRELERQALAKVLGAGVDTEWDDLLEVAQGYTMALDAERERVVRRVAEVVATSRAADNAPASEPSKLRCPRCLGECANEGKGNCTRAAGRTRYQVLSELDADGRRQLQVDHPAWFCARSAENACALQQPHAGVCLTFDELAAEYAPEEPEHPECPHCGEADGHKPKDCAMLERAEEPEDDDRPTMVESMERAKTELLIHASGRRLNGTAWRRSATTARAENSTTVCHHCGSHDDEDDDLKTVMGIPPHPSGTFCAGCRMRLLENPSEWERHFKAAETQKAKRGGRKAKQVTLEEAVAATKPRPPGRATKKFPKGGSDLAEKCTQCGAQLGEHDGTKCPKAALRGGTVPIHEQPETTEAVA